MSIVLARFSGDRGMLAVDSIGFEAPKAGSEQAGASPVVIGKMLLLPHLCAGLAVSGNTDLLTATYACMAAVRGGFDDVADAMLEGGLVNTAATLLQAQAAHHGFSIAPKQLIVLLGFSEREGRMRCIEAGRQSGEAFYARELEHGPGGGFIVSPPDPRVPNSIDDMLAIARDQVAANSPQFPLGGRLLVAIFEREALSLTARAL